jgi:hypothetical protein
LIKNDKGLIKTIVLAGPRRVKKWPLQEDCKAIGMAMQKGCFHGLRLATPSRRTNYAA